MTDQQESEPITIPAQPSDIPAAVEVSENTTSKDKALMTKYFEAVFSGTDEELKQTFPGALEEMIASHQIRDKYQVLVFLEPDNSIDDHDLNKIYTALKKGNGNREKDVLLVILSRGGSIEPAYQISKLCKAFAAKKFVVAVPRYAKSAATLIALGADEIHIGPLGQLGPIDPQLGGLPALGVSQAIRSIGRVAQEFPGSSEMLASYLRQALTVEQVGYCDRIAESAVQYAQRLLRNKGFLTEGRAQTIATRLVHEYKDHSFVIDQSEAAELLGPEWVHTTSEEITLSETIYSFFDSTNSLLSYRSKRILAVGDWVDGLIVLNVGKG